MAVPIPTLSPNGFDTCRREAPPDGVLVATMNGVVDLRRHGATWRAADPMLAGRHVSCLLADPSTERVVAGTHGDGVFVRDVPGASWQPFAAGLSSSNVFTLACARCDDKTVMYAGTEPAHLFRHDADARAWVEVEALRSVPSCEAWNFPAPPFVAHVKHVDVDPRDADVIYVAIEQGALLKSTDGGRTFVELVFRDDTYVLNNDVHRVVINPFDPDELYVPGGDGISYSRNGGQSWEHIQTPKMRIAYPDAMFCSPEEDGVVYVTGGGTSPDVWRSTGDARSGFARSRDRGRTWEALPLPELRGNIEAATLVTWLGGFGFFAGTTDGEVFWSGDRGESWSCVASGLAPVSKCIHHRNLALGRGAV